MSDAVEKLEREFAAWLGAAGAIATGFGRSALVLALEAVPVRGADVLVPNFICAQVPEAVLRAGGRPVFYPVQRDLGISPADFQAAITPETRAAVISHYFGRLLPQISTLASVCRERRIPLVEDCALALGASRSACRSGTLGDFAIFSFTKSDWCYGGGMVASRRPENLARMRVLRRENFRPCVASNLRYGWLRRIDFAANRPRRSSLAERAGRWLERVTGRGDGNFYDAGRFDAAMPAFAAPRARRILANLSTITTRRRQILRELTASLRSAGLLFAPEQEVQPGDAGSFLLIACSSARAEAWRKHAARQGVTLRRCWPAYQELVLEQQSEAVSWLADHLLLLEIHPRLTLAEVRGITRALRELARSSLRGKHEIA